jgi:hypothetical protein
MSATAIVESLILLVVATEELEEIIMAHMFLSCRLYFVNLSHLHYPVIMFLEKDFAFDLCLSVNVDFCCVGSVSSLNGTLHKAFLDVVVLFRNGVIR